MISLSAPSSRLHNPLAAFLVADVEVQRWESEGGAIVDRRLPPTPAEPEDVAAASRSPQGAPSETSALVHAVITVVVTITMMAVAALIIANTLFDDTQILLAAGAGTMVMTLVGLPTLLAAISDINEDARSSVDAARQRVDREDRRPAAGNPTARPTRTTLVPGRRVRVTRQIPKREVCWTPAIEGTIVSHRQEATGAWFAHSKNHKLWLDRLEIRHDDGELTDCILDSYTRVEILDDAAQTPVATVSGNGYASSRRARSRQRRRALSRPRQGARPAPRLEGLASLSQQEGA